MSLLTRNIQPEILDCLPPEHPQALRNRRDIRRINALMRAFSWHRRNLRLVRPDDRILEIGAGRGELLGYLRKHMPAFPLSSFTGLDVIPPSRNWPYEAKWLKMKLEEFHSFDSYTVVLANLILHQFEDSHLNRIGLQINTHARMLSILEPHRARRHLLQMSLGRLVGMGPITRHDGFVSIRAGFRGGELPALLNLDSALWHWEESITFWGAYRLRAIRR